MKKYIFLIAFLCMAEAVCSQNIRINTNVPVDFIKRKVYDFAKTTVLYDYECVKDSNAVSTSKRYGKTALLIGEQYWGFLDWASYQTDSLQDALAVQGGSIGDYFNASQKMKRLNGYEAEYLYPLVVNRQTGEYTMQISAMAFTNTYQYQGQLPAMEWTLVDEEKKIEGIACSKAECHFGGRDWIAWYSLEYSLPFGPYLFGGLPGLIVEAYDTKNHFSFKLSGISSSTMERPVYLGNHPTIIHTTREKARQAVLNESKDVMKTMLAKQPGLAKQNGGMLLNIKRSEPYNPIELE